MKYNYTIIVDGQSYDLEPYSESLEVRIQNDQRTLCGNADIAEKRKLQKAFIKDTLKDEELVKQITSGKADPNLTDRVYCEIVDAYISPRLDYNNEKNARKLNDAGLNELAAVMQSLGNLEALIKASK